MWRKEDHSVSFANNFKGIFESGILPLLLLWGDIMELILERLAGSTGAEKQAFSDAQPPKTRSFSLYFICISPCAHRGKADSSAQWDRTLAVGIFMMVVPRKVILGQLNLSQLDKLELGHDALPC